MVIQKRKMFLLTVVTIFEHLLLVDNFLIYYQKLLRKIFNLKTVDLQECQILKIQQNKEQLVFLSGIS